MWTAAPVDGYRLDLKPTDTKNDHNHNKMLRVYILNPQR